MINIPWTILYLSFYVEGYLLDIPAISPTGSNIPTTAHEQQEETKEQVVPVDAGTASVSTSSGTTCVTTTTTTTTIPTTEAEGETKEVTNQPHHYLYIYPHHRPPRRNKRDNHQCHCHHTHHLSATTKLTTHSFVPFVPFVTSPTPNNHPFGTTNGFNWTATT
jgi:hypothetical protein